MSVLTFGASGISRDLKNYLPKFKLYALYRYPPRVKEGGVIEQTLHKYFLPGVLI